MGPDFASIIKKVLSKLQNLYTLFDLVVLWIYLYLHSGLLNLLTTLEFLEELKFLCCSEQHATHTTLLNLSK